MNDDINHDEMKRFEDLGRKLFQVPKENVEDDDSEPSEEEPDGE